MQKIDTQIDSQQNSARFLSGLFVLVGFMMLPISTTLTDVFLLLSFLMLLTSGQLKESIQTIKNNPIALLFIGFFMLFLIGTTYSIAPTHDIIKSMIKNAKLLYGALLIPIFLEERWRKRAVDSLIMILTLVMVLSYLKAFGWIHLTDRYADAAVFKSHIQTNFFMAFFSYLLARKIFDDRPRQILWSVLFIAAVFKTLLFSEGRSGYVVFAALMMLFGWQRFSFKGLLITFISVSVLCGSAFFTSSHFQQRFNKVITDTQLYQKGDAKTSIGLRISFYKNAIKLITEHPVIGSGTGSLITRYQKVENNSALQTHNVHNEYLNVTIQLGLVGLSFLFYFFGTILLKSVDLPREYRELAQATLAAIAVGCLINSWLMDTVEGHFFAMMMAVCFAPLSRAIIPHFVIPRKEPLGN